MNDDSKLFIKSDDPMSGTIGTEIDGSHDEDGMMQTEFPLFLEERQVQIAIAGGGALSLGKLKPHECVMDTITGMVKVYAKSGAISYVNPVSPMILSIDGFLDSRIITADSPSVFTHQ